MDRFLEIRRLGADDAESYRELRLLGLRLHPEAFGSSFEEEDALSLDSFAERLVQAPVFGAWRGESLLGCGGLMLREKRKQSHKDVLWGMFVHPEARRVGIGKRLVSEILSCARTRCEEVVLRVVSDNLAARRLYATSGFQEYGYESRALKIGNDYYDEVMMRLPFVRNGASLETGSLLLGSAA